MSSPDANFAKALLYAEGFGKRHNSYLPHLGHVIGTQGGKPGGYYCLECDPTQERHAHTRKEVLHKPECPYLHYIKAVAAAKNMSGGIQ